MAAMSSPDSNCEGSVQMSQAEAQDLTNLPDPSRLIYGLRDTGYDLNTAAADIVDNSIAAGATEVNIKVTLENDGRKFVYFGDNGSGMSSSELFNAMRYGAPKRQNLKSLGKFGLGLKTASSSIAKKFTIITRNDASAPLEKLAWDLEHVEAENKWEMLKEPITQADDFYFSELCGDKGTLVIWSKCDRLLDKDYEEPGGSKEKNAIRARVNKLRDHLALVFHRFLDPKDNRERDVSIILDDVAVQAWNPFYPEKSEQVLPPHAQTLKIQTEDGSVHEAKLAAWILPHRKTLTDEENKIAKISNRAQGFYIYREGRVIHRGGWLGLFDLEPHFSLIRIEFDFDHLLDEAFKIDVKKSKVLFDPALEDVLDKVLTPFRNEANNRYRRKERSFAAETAINHQSANKTIAASNTQTASVSAVDIATQTATVNNRLGQGIKLHVPVENNVNVGSIYVETVNDMTSGLLWEPAVRSPVQSGHHVSVRINKHHDFFQKVYLRAGSQGYTVDGIDYLLWAFAAAEINNSNPELAAVFEDLRDEISSNLRKLLRDTPAASEADIEEFSPAQVGAEQ
jgi:hypothetical protein